MRSLYWKIFLAFWITTVVMLGAAVVLTTGIGDEDGLLSRWRGLEDGAARRSRLGDRLRRGDSAAAARFLRAVEARRGLRIFALDAEGNDLLDRPLPPAVRATLGSRTESGAGAGASGGAPTLVLRRVTLTDGNTLTLVREMGDRATRRRRPDPSWLGGLRPLLFGPPHGSPWVLWARLGVALVVSAAICYLLARYLTRPVVRLRDATRRLAGGDLEARVGPALGERRDEIADLGHDFDAMAERMGQLLGRQRRLLRDVSHELRSPLARLRVALALARERAGDRARDELDRIELEAERLDDLIEQVLALERLRSGTVRSRREVLDLDELVGEVVADADFESSAQGRRVVLHADRPCRVDGDPDQLRSAVENVVRNAMHHTATGTRVSVTVEAAGAQVRVVIRDRGPGVPEAALSHLFEPFFRAEEARERARGSHGLGLAIAAQAVRLHTGSIVARNAPDGGLEVEIRLPPGRRVAAPLLAAFLAGVGAAPAGAALDRGPSPSPLRAARADFYPGMLILDRDPAAARARLEAAIDDLTPG